MNVIKILSISEFKIIFKLELFFNKNLKNHILIFGKNNSKKKIIVSYLIQYYTRIILKKFCIKKKYQKLDKINQCESSDFFPNVEYLKIIYPKTKEIESKFLTYLDNKLSNLSRFKKNIKIVVIYQITVWDKWGNKNLYNIIKKNFNNFFFIFTTDSLSKFSISLKDKIFCFPVSVWNNILSRKRNLVNVKNIKKIFKQKNNNKKEILQMNSFSNDFFFDSLLKQKRIFKILFRFQTENYNKYNFVKNGKIEITIEHCLEKILLRNLVDLINSYSTYFSLFKLNLNYKWNKTKFLIAHIFNKNLQLNIGICQN
jgi:hypothetical protein